MSLAFPLDQLAAELIAVDVAPAKVCARHLAETIEQLGGPIAAEAARRIRLIDLAARSYEGATFHDPDYPDAVVLKLTLPRSAKLDGDLYADLSILERIAPSERWNGGAHDACPLCEAEERGDGH